MKNNEFYLWTFHIFNIFSFENAQGDIPTVQIIANNFISTKKNLLHKLMILLQHCTFGEDWWFVFFFNCSKLHSRHMY